MDGDAAPAPARRGRKRDPAAQLPDLLDVGPLATHADAERALQGIAVMSAAEDYWTKAKNAEQLFRAVETKLRLQAEYIVWRDGVRPSQREYGKRGGRGKKAVTEPLQPLPEGDPGKMAASRWRQRFCKKLAARTVVDAEKLQAAIEDAQGACQRICEQQNLGTVRGTEGTGEFERYTPAAFIEPVRAVLGEIDLDPATCLAAQETVKAVEFFTAEDNGLKREWHGRVFLNPPYHRELCPAFIEKLIDEIKAGRVDQAIVLVNNCADTEWFDTAAALCESICFTRGRIRFFDQRAKEVLPTQGQAYFYFGPNLARFEEVFDRSLGGSVGRCYRPVST